MKSLILILTLSCSLSVHCQLPWTNQWLTLHELLYMFKSESSRSAKLLYIKDYSLIQEELIGQIRLNVYFKETGDLREALGIRKFIFTNKNTLVEYAISTADAIIPFTRQLSLFQYKSHSENKIYRSWHDYYGYIIILVFDSTKGYYSVLVTTKDYLPLVEQNFFSNQ